MSFARRNVSIGSLALSLLDYHLAEIRAYRADCAECNRMSREPVTTPEDAHRFEAGHRDLPLYVDLDGTLIRSDLLWESLCLLARERPSLLARLPVWLLAGKAGFKARLASQVAPDPATLPYRPEVLAYVESERRHGRRVVLASASNRVLVAAVADHLALFDGVLASDGSTNLSGDEKRVRIEADAGSGRAATTFEYMGNSRADLPIWRRAEVVTLVSPSRAAQRGIAATGRPHEIIATQQSPWRAALRAIRMYQWAKNALLFAPLLLAHQLGDLARLRDVLLTFAGFCATASAGYLLNDLLDIEADRQHIRKRERPLASGMLPIPFAILLIVGLLGGGFGASLLLLPSACTAMLAAYLLLTLSYSFYFKQRLMLDVLLLAGLYTHRVLTGGVAAAVPLSPWLLAFSTFFFLSLALVKRYVELLAARTRERENVSRRAYEVGDLSLVETMGVACGYISVLVLCLFVNSDEVSKLYRTPDLLWLMCPIMLYWISRVWLLARRGELHDDPVLFATTDRNSYFAGALIGAVVMAATW